MKDLSIVIVNYNTSVVLADCLTSISKYLDHRNLEVIVVDNNSTDRTISQFPERFSQVKFYFRKLNNGFGAACNFGATKANGKFLLFLNPDVKLIDNSISKLEDFLNKNETVGACSGLLINENYKPTYNFNFFPSYSWEFKEAFGIHVEKTVKELLSNPSLINNTPFEVDWFHGACLMVRKSVFDELGGFDEKFFLYYEDIDLQKRIIKLGYKIYCVPEVKVFHATQSSVKSKNGQRIYHHYMHLSKLYYMQKYFNIIKRNIIRLFYIFGYINKLLILPFRKKYSTDIKEKFIHYWIILKLYLLKFNVRSAR